MLSDSQKLNQYKNKTKQTANLKLYFIENNLVDVFSGEGWLNQGRYRRIKGRWTPISGSQLNTTLNSEFLSNVNRKSN